MSIPIHTVEYGQCDFGGQTMELTSDATDSSTLTALKIWNEKIIFFNQVFQQSQINNICKLQAMFD